jgi:signal transduction histidine kinase
MADNQDIQYVLARPRQHLAVHVRARRMQLILLAVLFYIPALVISITTLVSSNHWWGVIAQPLNNASGAWQVTWSDRGLSTDSNIQVGDQILQAGGRPPQNEDEINQANELEILSPGAARAHMVRWQAPNQLDTLLSLSWLVLGFVSLLLGLLVFLHATDRPLARRFFLLWIALAIANSLVPATSFGNLLAVHISGILYSGVATGLLASFLWRLLLPVSASGSVSSSHQPSTPERARGFSRYHWLGELPVATGLLFAILYLFVVTLQQPDWLKWAVALGSVQTIFGLGLSLFLILIIGLSRRPGVARERARTLLGGMLLGLTPPLALTVIPQLISGYPLVPGTVSDLAIIVLPLAFAYAIVRRDLLRVDSLLRNTTLILLTVIGMSLLAVLLAAALAPLPTTPALIIGITAGAVLAPFVLAGARWITEAWLFPQVRRYRRRVAQGDSIERTGLDPQRVARQLISEVHLALPVYQIAVFAPDKETGHLLAIAVSHAQARPGGAITASPTSRTVISLTAAAPQPPETPGYQKLFIDEPLSNRLYREGGPFLVEAAPMDRNAPESYRARIQQNRESWRLLVPMRVRGRLVGLLALSRREDDQAYSDTDLRVLRFLAGRRALALDYALLYADLHTAYERRQELDRLKDQFIVTAHHELRTPLTGVQGYLELLRELGPEGRATRPEEVDLFIERACRATDELNEQLDSLLAAAESNLSQENLKLRPVELSSVAQRAILSLDALAHRGRHRVRNTIPPDFFAIADEEALYRIFMNLLSNALKYSQEGRPVLFDGHIRLVRSLAAAGAAQVAEVIVRDWGVGIARADQHKIFERFTRLERDLNSPVRGSGLGLAICKELLEAMGGTIWVESEGVPGSGSTFYIRLPLAEASVSGASSSEWGDISAASDLGNQEKSPGGGQFL